MLNFTDEANKAISYAAKAAAYHRQNYAGTEHLLAGLLKASGGTASHVLTEAGITAEKLTRLIDRLIAPQGGCALMEKPGFSPRAQKVIGKSEQIAEELGSREIGTEHLLLSMLRDTECVGTRLLHTMGADIRKLYADTLTAMNVADRYSEQDLLSGKMMRETAGATPTLDQYGRDLTKMAAEGKLDPVVGRNEEIMRVMQILSRRTKNNPCLIGEPGVGKTAIVEGLAKRIADGDVPDAMAGKRLVILDLTGMVAGSKYRGEFEERIRNVVKEVAANRNILLFIDELHTLIGAGGAEGALDASNILKPSLSRGEIQVIGATTIDEYRKHIEKDAALERRFQPVTVEEPGAEEAVEILKGLRPYYEKHHHTVITDEALEAAVRLSERYINDRRLPDKAIDLIDEASSKVRIGLFRHTEGVIREEEELHKKAAEKERAILAHDMALAQKLQKEQDALAQKIRHVKDRRASDSSRQIVTEEVIAQVVSEWTRIPVVRLREQESRRLAKLEKELHRRVIGQEEAVTAVAGAIRRGRAGLKDPRRPTGSFLFLGPTGVGKTELSKAVAETVFGSEQNLIRVDMSEYMEKYSVSKLIGSPPGYVGYDEGGQLSEQVRRHPYSVILFDEIEKAHPDVFNILLQVLDDGHITDAHGRRVDFKNTCIIMTSNAGAKSIVDPKRLGFSAGADEEKDYEDMKRGVMEEVRRIFKPEFLNRIDETIVFHPLTQKEVEEIAGLLLKALTGRAKEQMNLTIRISPAVKKNVAKKGFSPKYGARPVRRVIQNEIENPAAEMIVRGECGEGGTLSVSVRGGQLQLTAE
ncbi:MAG: ATP-dependent Clp protease ATP-binding subunit [Lachnospiraceae bacterium]|nr:ATP-dependent Clp protease ATP-binding subunit [Lachnospiraceae bacterium]